MTSDKALVFGATGALGSGIVQHLELQGVAVVQVTRGERIPSGWLTMNSDFQMSGLSDEKFSRVIWAQGANASGGLGQGLVAELDVLLSANVKAIAATAIQLLEEERLVPHARMCILSSVWQDLARPDKIAYITSKAAVGGLMRALAVDLGAKGIAINAILPGVIDTPMSREFLGVEGIANVERDSAITSLATIEDVARATAWLTSSDARGITGQSIHLDQGWGIKRNV
jgi:3-oxoacyl-[acyl-carrier protein] reductase